MRGKDGAELSAAIDHGITPAHAGKRCHALQRAVLAEDHPRTRGEKPDSFRMAIFDKGSPPRMRGKVAFRHHHALFLGITPAHAGKSVPRTRSIPAYKDHPRTRGEKTITPISFISHIGSPPHTRGKAAPVCGIMSAERITPAHAGKSLWMAHWCCKLQDHPRTRGEKYKGVII